MSSSLEDIAYDIYIADIALEETRLENIQDFKNELLKRHYLKNPNILLNAKTAYDSSVALFYMKFYNPSFVFSFISTELLIKDIIVKPLFRGQLVDDEFAEILIENFSKSNKNFDSYSKLLNNFVRYFGDVDLKDFNNRNLIQDFKIQAAQRNGVIHTGDVVDKDHAMTSLSLTEQYLEVAILVCKQLGLKINRNNWSVS